MDVSAEALFRWLGFTVATPVGRIPPDRSSRRARSIAARQPRHGCPWSLPPSRSSMPRVCRGLARRGHVYFDPSPCSCSSCSPAYLEMRARHHAGDLSMRSRASRRPCRSPTRGSFLERIGIHELRAGDRVHVGEEVWSPPMACVQCRPPRSMRRSSRRVGAGPATARMRHCRQRSRRWSGRPACGARRADTVLAGSQGLVERAQIERPHLLCAGEQATGRFVVRVLSLTVLTAAAWSAIDPSRVFAAALAVLSWSRVPAPSRWLCRQRLLAR